MSYWTVAFFVLSIGALAYIRKQEMKKKYLKELVNDYIVYISFDMQKYLTNLDDMEVDDGIYNEGYVDDKIIYTPFDDTDTYQTS